MKDFVVDKKEAEKVLSGFVRELIEREARALSSEYLNWLAEFVKREEAFDDEANRVEYCGKYTEEEKEKIHLVSTLFSIVDKYYDKNGIEQDVLKADFFNQGVTVNLTDDVSIEMRLWCGQGSVTDVSLIAPKSGKVDIKDVIAANAK